MPTYVGGAVQSGLYVTPSTEPSNTYSSLLSPCTSTALICLTPRMSYSKREFAGSTTASADDQNVPSSASVSSVARVSRPVVPRESERAPCSKFVSLVHGSGVVETTGLAGAGAA
jgi:hypothetical protein